ASVGLTTVTVASTKFDTVDATRNTQRIRSLPRKIFPYVTISARLTNGHSLSRGPVMNLVVIALYIGAMLGIGVYARRRAKSEEEFLVAGRRLGPMLYAGTMAAVVLGGASTVGAVGLGYRFGISGMWLVFFIGSGILLMSL